MITDAGSSAVLPRLHKIGVPVLITVALVFGGRDSSVAAQTIQGQVTDRLTGEPVGRGFVVLVDTGGVEVARTLSDREGNFSLSVRTSGRYRLRAEVIGFQLWESAPFSFTPRMRVNLPLRISRIPVVLDALEIRGESGCASPESDAATGALWKEARKALGAAAWGNSQGEFASKLHRYRRMRLPNGGVEREEIWVVSGTATQPFGAVDPARLAEQGYVVERGGRRRYFGPDADVLLHPSFQGTHCFGAVRGRGPDEGLLGLSFAPLPERDRTDIEGVAWIDAATSELRRIVYRYTELPFAFQDDRLGGMSVFHRTPSGAWLMSSWEITAPVVQVRNVRTPAGLSRTEEILAGYLEIGGAVVEMRNSAGEREYVAPDASLLAGLLYDSTRTAPAAFQRVEVAGTGYWAVTDSLGVFRLLSLLRGTYRMSVSRLDSMAYEPGVGRARFVRGDTTYAHLAIPSMERVWGFLCPENGVPPRRRALVGTVRETGSRQGVSGAEVEMSWASPSTVRGTRRNRRIVESYENGDYVVCDLPLGTELSLTVESRNYATRPVTLMFTETEAIVEVDDIERRYPVSDRVWRFDVLVFPRP